MWFPEVLMAWRFLLDDRLREFNEGRSKRGRDPLRWADVSFLIGVSRQSLQNLASNRELKVTNTRLLDSLCRFFDCKLTDLMEPVPESVPPMEDEEIDRLMEIRDRQKADGVPERDFALGEGDRPPFHIDVLYGADARENWKGSAGGED